MGLVRNKGMALISTISITAVLVLFGIVLLLILNMTGFVAEAGNKVDSVVVYLQDEATDQEIQTIISKAEETGYVKDVEFTSKEEALKEFQEKLEMDGNGYLIDELDLIDGLDENPLPPSITLRLSNIEETEGVAEAVRNLPGVYQASYLDETVTKVIQITGWVKILGVIIVGILLVIAIVLIHNTIKATVSNRQEEIHIMKYIGASNGYIRRPLLIEGVIFGFLASAIALAIVYFGYGVVFEIMEERLRVSLGMRLLTPKEIILDVGIIFACIGMGIGLIGSSLSVKRYLNV